MTVKTRKAQEEQNDPYRNLILRVHKYKRTKHELQITTDAKICDMYNLTYPVFLVSKTSRKGEIT